MDDFILQHNVDIYKFIQDYINWFYLHVSGGHVGPSWTV